MKPTCEQIFDEGLGDPIYHEDDTSWRHGSYRTEVYFRASDSTHWQVKYRLSSDGETNELREGHAKITQVEPYEKTVILYRPVPEGKDAG